MVGVVLRWGFCSKSCWDVKTYSWGISGICECHCSYSRAALAAFWAHVLLLLAHSLPCSTRVSRKTLDILRICFLLIFLFVCHLLTFAHDLKLSQHCPYVLLHHLLPECYQISFWWKRFCCFFFFFLHPLSNNRVWRLLLRSGEVFCFSKCEGKQSTCSSSHIDLGRGRRKSVPAFVAGHLVGAAVGLRSKYFECKCHLLSSQTQIAWLTWSVRNGSFLLLFKINWCSRAYGTLP